MKRVGYCWLLVKGSDLMGGTSSAGRSTAQYAVIAVFNPRLTKARLASAAARKNPISTKKCVSSSNWTRPAALPSTLVAESVPAVCDKYQSIVETDEQGFVRTTVQAQAAPFDQPFSRQVQAGDLGRLAVQIGRSPGCRCRTIHDFAPQVRTEWIFQVPWRGLCVCTAPGTRGNRCQG